MVGGALGRGEDRYWPSNGTVVGDIDTWGCEGFAESSAMWALQSWHGFLPLFFFVPFTSGLLLPKLVVEE